MRANQSGCGSERGDGGVGLRQRRRGTQAGGAGGDGGGPYGGGASYVDEAFSAAILLSGAQSGDGQVVITSMATSAPELSTWALMATGFASLGLAGLGRGRRAAAA